MLSCLWPSPLSREQIILITSAGLQEAMEQRGEAREGFLEEVAPVLSLQG